jgi:hypothetical protein
MPREELNSAHVEWSRRHFGMMANHGTLAVLRSGLIFTKTDENTLTLTARMPWNEGIAHSAQLGADVPKNQQELESYQLSDFEVIASHFRAAGITVKDITNVSKQNN